MGRGPIRGVRAARAPGGPLGLAEAAPNRCEKVDYSARQCSVDRRPRGDHRAMPPLGVAMQ